MNNSLLEPFIICGAPGGGTSYFTKFLRGNGFFAGTSLEVGRDKHDHLGYIHRRKWHESPFMSATLTKPLLTQMGISHDAAIQGHYELVYNKLQEYGDGWWQELVDNNYSKFSGRLEEEFLPAETPYGWKDPRNVYLLPFWKKIFPKAKILTVTREMNPTPSQEGYGRDDEGVHFAKNVGNPWLDKLYYGHEDDFRFRFEDFYELNKVNELLTFVGFNTIDSFASLKAMHKELKFQPFKIGIGYGTS